VRVLTARVRTDCLNIEVCADCAKEAFDLNINVEPLWWEGWDGKG